MSRARPWPMELDFVSAKIGLDRELVQGPGGNTSWKNGREVWVKASGFQLREAIENEIFCQVSLDSPLVNNLNDGKRPSIEALLHASRPERFVIHVHSVSSIAFGCIKHFETPYFDLMDQLDLAIVEYARPGAELALEIEKSMGMIHYKSGAILRNHGLLCWGDDIEEVYGKVLEIESAIAEFLNIESARVEKNSAESLPVEKFITPDHAVFSKSIKNKKSGWLVDLDWAIKKALDKIPPGREVAYLSDEEVYSLVNWEAEQARIEMNT